jgi:multidrug efflux pump subunit AcrA (membrane-fusion protein)
LRAGTRVLSPGLFAHVKLPVGDPHAAMLVPEQALSRDQGQRVLFVVEQSKVEKKNQETKKDETVLVDKVFKRKVEVRPHGKGMMVIESGLQPGERVVVTGLQRIRNDMEVRAELWKPPVMAASAKPAASSE